MRFINGIRATAAAAAVAVLVLAGCKPRTSSPEHGSAAHNAPAGVTSSTERNLDSQPAVGSVRATMARDEGLADLKQVALFYLNDQTDGAQARESVLKDLQKNMPKVYKAVQQGDYVLLSGDPGIAPAGASNTIVAYTRDAPTKGGVAAFLDGHVIKINAPEFKAAAKLGR